jgi:PST family polysaccharide transporter
VIGGVEQGQLATKAVRGAAWTIAAGLGSRVLGLFATLLLTYYLDPRVIGEVAGASVLVLSANQLSTFGVGQYVIAKPAAGRDVIFHATFIHLVTGVVAIVGVLSLGSFFSDALRSPTLARYMPGFVVSVLVDRVSFMPERLLARDMNFRALGLGRTLGEITYGSIALVLAVTGFGGMAIVLANIARSALRLTYFLANTERARWCTPSRLSKPIVRDMLRFGMPLWVGGVADFASRRWDNLLVSMLFGPAVMGEYNMAYNLAEIPGNQIGEQIGDVMLPTFASIDLERKKRAVTRALGITALVVFPVAVGLGAVAPTLVATLLPKKWEGVAPMLAVLSVMSVVRPYGWTLSNYLQSRDKTRPTLWLEVGKVALLIGFIYALGFIGPIWACAGVGLAFAIYGVASMMVVRALDGITLRAFLVESARPLAACVPLVCAVLAARWTCMRAGLPIGGAMLVCEIIAGAIAYAAGARVVARDMVDDVVRLLGSAMRRGPRDRRRLSTR